MTTIFRGFFKFVIFLCPVIKHNYDKFIIIGRILNVTCNDELCDCSAFYFLSFDFQ